MDIRSALAAQSYARSRPATQPDPAAAAPAGAAGRLATGFADTLRAGESAAAAAVAGRADPHALVQALAASELAVETAVTLRNKVVEAYQELLRMPV
ncbi:MAG: flagellar hook-basal body complex protein FliE [Rhodobacteraceae bacterium]|jgi:flagellar hook-basal body complex protein FliE|nr:flagellar hook-basal body complex protein FliE [Paracoccaceae bacterium]